MHNDEIVQREGSTLTRESFNNVAPALTIRQRIHEIENIAPITTFFKSFLDPVIVTYRFSGNGFFTLNAIS